ncbi:MAG TPA: hypothetical protein VK922_04420 [Gemmatimonadaceae bacterium]|nr:hypothetical protein [Gemmatimonadaceae bacterium]
MSLTIGALAGCGGAPGSSGDARDVAESGAATDVIGRPEGADSIPPRMTDRSTEPPLPPESLPAPRPVPDDSIRRPERRPIRKLPPLTRPDSGTPDA